MEGRRSKQAMRKTTEKQSYQKGHKKDDSMAKSEEYNKTQEKFLNQ